MMSISKYLNRSGLAAIAAATAFLATPAAAQEAAPIAADPAPIVADTPLPAEPVPTVEAAPDTLAPAATTGTTARTTRNTSPTRATPAPAARTVRTSVPAVATPVIAAPAAPVAEATPAFDPAMVAPLPEPAAAAPAPVENGSMIDNDILPIAGAAGLGILALAGAGFAMRRRRREDDVLVDEEYREPLLRAATPMPVATTPVIANAPIIAANPKPAFNWGNAPREMAPSMSRIDAARRGPTSDNPSLSLKKRLQRAAFFDQRDRAVAAGKAVPISPMAGLPDALAKPAVTTIQPAPSPAPTFGLNRTFQPA